MAMTAGRAFVAKQVGRRIRDIRKDRGMSQETLARKAEVSTGTIYRAEAGRMVPEWETLEAIASALQVDLGHLVQFEGDTRVYVKGLALAIA